MPVYSSLFVPIDDLDAATREAMLEIFLRHYAETDAATFRKDLREKNEVQLLHADGSLVGFSTLLHYFFDWQGQRRQIVFSGDTVVSREHWGQQRLAADWLAHMGERLRRQPETPLYWFLIVKGHRTFRYLDVFARSYFPGKENGDIELAPLAAALARQRFGDCYDAERGLLIFPPGHGCLAADIAEPTAAECRKPAVQDFLRRNPSYRRGDELVCLCRLHADNLQPLARRFFAGKRI